MILLKQSTAATLILGPFVDDADGKTAETALTISQSDVRLSKNGSDPAQKNDATSATHKENGYYAVALDATDTGTAGWLRVMVSESGALPVLLDCLVLVANVYDSLVAGTDALEVDATQWKGSTAPAMTGDAYARVGAAGAGLTALGDTRLAYLDAAVSSISGSIVAQAVASILSGTELTIVNNASIDVDFTGLGDMTGWDSVYFTIKQSKGLPDADAWLQIKLTGAGTEITRVGKAAPATGTKTDGSITITSVGTGALTVAVAPRSALLIPLGKGIYDIAMVEDGVKTILASGDCVVTATATTTYA